MSFSPTQQRSLGSRVSFPAPMRDQAPLMTDDEYESGEPRNHHRFYIEDGDTILQVNNALFCVHRHFLAKHSTVLKDTLSLPRPITSNPTRDRFTMDPIQFSGDSVVGWEWLLGLFYLDDPCRPVVYTAEQWAAVVLLANKYMMEGIELSALQQLRDTIPSLDDVDMMVLAQKVDSEELYHSALQSLAQRDQVLSLEDAQKIGIKAFHDVVTTEHVYFTRSRRQMGKHPRPSGVLGQRSW